VKISVIIPTYNRAETIERAVESVLNQTCQDFELRVVDDGSSDNTSSILSKYFSLKNFFYHKIPNRGVSFARNYGVDSSEGEYLAFLDSDDEWHSDKLEKQLKFIEEHPEFSIVHAHERWMRNGVEVKIPKRYQKSGGDIFVRSLDQCIISPSVALMSKDLFLKYGGFREDFTVCEDYDLWLKITSQNQVGFIDEALATKYGGHEDQLSTKFFAMDYWRVLSMNWILENRDLDSNKKLALVEMIIKKGSVLITGYLKHDNLKDLHEIKTVVESAQEIKCYLLKE
jgi:glycosyltransferase involved in cell wall biosynthesis